MFATKKICQKKLFYNPIVTVLSFFWGGGCSHPPHPWRTPDKKPLLLHILVNFQALAKMLPEWQQFFFKISKFSSAGRNGMATKCFFQNFQALAKMLPEWQQNVFSNFQVMTKMLPKWQQNVFSKFSSAGQNLAILATFWSSLENLKKTCCCHSDNILASA